MTPIPDTGLTIEREIVIDAPIEVVWNSITEPDAIAQWFADRVELDAVPGGRGVLVFENGGGESTHVAPLVVEAVERPTRFAFRWCHPEGATPTLENSMLVEFTLAAQGPECTRLKVAEYGLERLDWASADKQRYAEEHNGGWAEFTGRLARLLGTSRHE